MAIPDFQSIMMPFLKTIVDGREYTMPETRQLLAEHFNLTKDELSEKLPSGKMSTFSNRVAWTKAYLSRAKLVENIRRGVFLITEQGLQVVKENPERINIKYLMRFPSFQKFRSKKPGAKGGGVTENIASVDNDAEKTPIEQIGESYQDIRKTLADEILDQVLSSSPTFFENVVVELLVKMGYGGTIKDAGQAIGKVSDEGIDGVIKQDRLGLDIIYIQAKRWDKDHTVSRPEIQKFAGALQGKRSRKGVFITTSRFSQKALDYAKDIENKIILIDGDQFAQLMIDFSLGVTLENTFEIKKIDSDYFLEE